MNLENPKKTEEALKWIVEILDKNKIPFVITAGFAAQIYGATRKLNDIDIDIPEIYIEKIAEQVKPYITYGPTHHVDEWWDLPLITLDYKGQIIDISGAEKIKVRNPLTKQWLPFPTTIDKAKRIKIFDIELPFIDKQELINYKSILAIGWPHQKNDVDEMINSKTL